MKSLHLDDYDMSAERGFLCRYNAEDIKLGGDLGTARQTAMHLPEILPTGQVRNYLTQNFVPVFYVEL